MLIEIDLNSESVTYEDIGAKPRGRRARLNTGRRGARVRKPQAQDPFSKLKRQRTNLRSGIKKRLDGIRMRTIDASKIGQTRQEMRSMFQEFKRVDARYKRMKESGAQTPKRSRTTRGRQRR